MSFSAAARNSEEEAVSESISTTIGTSTPNDAVRFEAGSLAPDPTPQAVGEDEPTALAEPGPRPLDPEPAEPAEVIPLVEGPLVDEALVPPLDPGPDTDGSGLDSGTGTSGDDDPDGPPTVSLELRSPTGEVATYDLVAPGHGPPLTPFTSDVDRSLADQPLGLRRLARVLRIRIRGHGHAKAWARVGVVDRGERTRREAEDRRGSEHEPSHQKPPRSEMPPTVGVISIRAAGGSGAPARGSAGLGSVTRSTMPTAVATPAVSSAPREPVVETGGGPSIDPAPPPTATVVAAPSASVAAIGRPPALKGSATAPVAVRPPPTLPSAKPIASAPAAKPAPTDLFNDPK